MIRIPSDRLRPAFWLPVLAVAGCMAEMPTDRDAARAEDPDEGLDRSVYELPRTAPATCRGGMGPKLVNGRPATWTMLVYEAVDNNLEPYAEADMEQMRLGHSGTPSVNVALQFDKASAEGMWRYEIARDATSGQVAVREVERSAVEPDSGNALTIAQFAEWGVTCYPAENYVFIVGGHGGGYSRHPVLAASEARSRAASGRSVTRFLAPDDHPGPGEDPEREGTEVLVPELAKAIRTVSALAAASGGHLQIYGSDACLMQTIEVASALRNATEYIVGSEELEPGNGWAYSTLLREWTSSPDLFARRPRNLAAAMVETFGRAYSLHGGQGYERENTLAAVDTAFLARSRRTIKGIAELMATQLRADPDFAKVVWAAADASPRFSDVNIDLGKFLVELRRGLVSSGLTPEYGQLIQGRSPAYRTLREKIDEFIGRVMPASAGPHNPTEDWADLVVRSTAGEAYPDSMGLSIYLPMEACDWSLDIPTYVGSSFAVDTGWGQVVSELIEHHPHAAVPRYRAQGTLTVETSTGRWDTAIDCSTAGTSFDVIEHEAEEAEDAPAPTEPAPPAPTTMAASFKGSFADGGRLGITMAEIYGTSPDIDAYYFARGPWAPLPLVTSAPYAAGQDLVGTVNVPAIKDRESGVPVSARVSLTCTGFAPITYCDAVGAPPGF